MDAIIAANTVPLALAAAPPAAGVPGYPTDGVPGITPPTTFPAYHYSGLIQEILTVIRAGGLTPDRANLGQLLASIQSLSTGPSSTETAARIAADNAEAAARIAGDATEATARDAQIVVEQNGRIYADGVETAARNANVASLVAGINAGDVQTRANAAADAAAAYLSLGGGTVNGQVIVYNGTYCLGYDLVCATNGNYHPCNSRVTGFSASETETNIYNETGAALLVGTGNNASNMVNFYYQGIYVAGISTNGTSISYNTTSDYRLKVNIVPLSDALARVKSVPVHRFAWASDIVEGTLDPAQVDGFLAHEAASIVPEAVTGAKDQTKTSTHAVLDPQGGVLAEGVTETEFAAAMALELPSYPTGSQWAASTTVPVYQAIDQSKLVPVLWAAVQELAALVAGQAADIAALQRGAASAHSP